MASVIVKMADNTRKAAVNLPGNMTIGQLLQATQQKWNLPSNANYAVKLERTGQQLESSATLESIGVEENDIFAVFPILEAGTNECS